MVKLVGVVGGDVMRAGEGGRECLARRQITLGIEADLKMVVALDDNCLACGPGEREPREPGRRDPPPAVHHIFPNGTGDRWAKEAVREVGAGR